jgi:integrase
MDESKVSSINQPGGIPLFDDLSLLPVVIGVSLWLKLKGCSQQTVNSYIYDLGVFSRWYRGFYDKEFLVTEMNTVSFQLFRKFSLIEREVKPATWNKRLAMLRNLAAWAMEIGEVKEDAAKGLERAEEIQLSPKWLTDRDYAHFLTAVEGNLNGSTGTFRERKAYRDRAICLLMSEAGLRESEVCKLKWKDMEIKPRSGDAWIQMSKREVSGWVPLNNLLRKALTAWREFNLNDAEDNLICVGITGRTIQDIVGEIGRKAKLDVTPHQLRHTFCHRVYLSSGLLVANRLMRHKRLSTTARYAEPSKDELTQAVEKISL